MSLARPTSGSARSRELLNRVLLRSLGRPLARTQAFYVVTFQVRPSIFCALHDQGVAGVAMQNISSGRLNGKSGPNASACPSAYLLPR